MSNLRLVAALVSCALPIVVPATAYADVVLRDQDGWMFYSKGLVGTHYEFIEGDGDPVSNNNTLVGGKIRNNVSQDENNKLAGSRIRSGFIGTQIGFGVVNKISETLEARAFLAVSVNGVDSSKGTPPPVKGVDFREAWAALSGSFGTFSFGRMFSIFASASGEIVSYAFANAVGHPCLADESNISCGSVGAGPLYAGFNAQLRYATPRLAGFGIQLAIEDPAAVPGYHITTLPRTDGELSYEIALGTTGKIVVKGQGMAQKLGRLNTDSTGTESVWAWGAMGAARIEAGGFKLGAGAWTGSGMGTHMAMQQDDQANPLVHDKPGGGFAGYELRAFRGLFGNLAYGYRWTTLAVGGGAVNVRETDADADEMNRISLIKQNAEVHIVLTQRIHSVMLSAELMHWRTSWHRGETQVLNFAGAGANFAW